MEVEAVVVVVVACISIYSQEINANTYITSTALLVFQLALAGVRLGGKLGNSRVGQRLTWDDSGRLVGRI